MTRDRSQRSAGALPQRAHRVAVVGALGRMGERVRAALADHPELRLCAALEASGHPGLATRVADDVTVTDDVKAALADCEVVIDFSLPSVTLATLTAAAEAGIPYVTGTTGLSAEERDKLVELSQRVPIIHAANFSLSVNLLAWLVRQAARRLGPDFDAELLEIHHAAKRDAPSGTALHLAEQIARGRSQSLGEKLLLAREGETGPRPEGAIAVQTLRGGDNPGEHTVFFVGRGERLELAHRAQSRDHFALGALRAAAWLIGRPPGLYPIEEVFELAD